MTDAAASSLPDDAPDMATFDPAELDVAARYKLLIGGIVPRPIAVVGTVDGFGRTNLAPYSFFNGVGSDPMLLLFCPANQPSGKEKDSLRNAKPVIEGGTGMFVVNVATESMAREISAASEPLPFGESELDMAGLRWTPGSRVVAPRLIDAPVAFECHTTQVIRSGADRPNAGNIVIGEVVMVHVRKDLVNDRHHIDADGLRAIGRMGGSSYATTRERFDVPRGKPALDTPDPTPG
ncbi:MAG: flavin reductase family protein [Phycisphaerales bacterium]